jgi:csp2 family CRISPR-associated protein
MRCFPYRLHTPAKPAIIPAANPPESPETSMKKSLRILTLALFALVISACSDKQSDPKTFAKAYVTETLNGDIEQVIAWTYTSPEFLQKHHLSADGMKEQMRQAGKVMREQTEKNQGLDSVTVNDIAYSDGKTKARAFITIKTKNGESRNDEIPLIQIDGKWRAGE